MGLSEAHKRNRNFFLLDSCACKSSLYQWPSRRRDLVNSEPQIANSNSYVCKFQKHLRKICIVMPPPYTKCYLYILRVGIMQCNYIHSTVVGYPAPNRFFDPRSSCTTTHILADVQRTTLNATCMTISGERTEQLNIFCHVTGFTSDFLSFIDVELIRFFHGALQLRWCLY